jgi:hypothetical protein
VNPLNRYAQSLAQFRDPRFGHYRPHVEQRFVLSRFAKRGLGALTHPHPVAYVRQALGLLSVDVACLFPGHPATAKVLADAGWRPMRAVPNLDCWHAP